jgi:ERCC4-type nuclease
LLKIVIDTREKEGYAFSTPSIHKKLDAGDYSIEGLESCISVERKSMEDFVQTVINGKKRFHKELKKLQKYEAACIVVEANYSDFINGKYRSGAKPNSILGIITSIIVEYGIPIYFCSDRQAACHFVERYLVRFYQKREMRYR